MQNILQTLVSHDFEAVLSIDTASRRYHFTFLREKTLLNVPSDGDFDAANERFADTQIVVADRDHFLKEIRLEKILAEVEKTENIISGTGFAMKRTGFSTETCLSSSPATKKA